MAFIYAYSLSDEEIEVKDFPLTGTVPAHGDAVILNASGQVTLAAANPTTLLGVFEGANFQGLVASGQPYAAVTVTNNSQGTTIGKVRVAGNAVYRVPYVTASGVPVVGVKYGCTSGTAPVGANAVLDKANTTQAIFTVVDVDTANAVAFVSINTRQLI